MKKTADIFIVCFPIIVALHSYEVIFQTLDCEARVIFGDGE